MPKKKTDHSKKLEREALRNLDVEISFLEGLVRRDPEYIEALAILGDDYTQRGRFQAGLEVDQRLSQLCPSDPDVHYNLACSFALTERAEEACLTLDHAIELGYRDFRWLNSDPDLDSVRAHPHFRKIVALIKKMRVRIK
jgi:tetratricopeptide (TPR) repeat protein